MPHQPSTLPSRTGPERERGASAVEYGLLIASIAGLVVAAVIAFGGFTDDLLSEPCDELAANEAAAAC